MLIVECQGISKYCCYKQYVYTIANSLFHVVSVSPFLIPSQWCTKSLAFPENQIGIILVANIMTHQY